MTAIPSKIAAEKSFCVRVLVNWSSIDWSMLGGGRALQMLSYLCERFTRGCLTEVITAAGKRFPQCPFLPDGHLRSSKRFERFENHSGKRINVSGKDFWLTFSEQIY